MITINTVDDDYFTLDGIRYPRIYQPLKQGLEAIAIYNIFDTRQQLVNSTDYDEYTIDSVVYGSQAATIIALLGVIYSPQGGGSGTAYDPFVPLSVTGSGSYALDASTMYDVIVLEGTNGQTYSVGTTIGGNQILDGTFGTEAVRIPVWLYDALSITIYFTGTFSVKIFKR